MKIVSLILAGAALVAATGADAQSLNGKRIGIQYYFPTQTSLYETSGVNTVGTSAPTSVAGTFSLSFTDATATASSFQYPATWTSAAFNGFRLYDIDGNIDDFNVTLGASNMVGLDASRLSGDANNLYVNWQGLSFDNATSVTLNFAQATAAVPEPATWAMMLVGFGAIGVGLRRRKAGVRTAVRFA